MGFYFLKFLGIGTLVTILTLLGQFYSLPPELMIESVEDVSPNISYLSRLIVRNTGGIPAVDLNPSIGVEDIFDQRKIGVVGITYGTVAPSISRLGPGESVPIQIDELLPNIAAIKSDYVHFSAELKIEYRAKLLFLSKGFEKTWRIRLVRIDDRYSWLIQVM